MGHVCGHSLSRDYELCRAGPGIAGLGWLKLPQQVCGYPRGRGCRAYGVGWKEVPVQGFAWDSGLHGLVARKGFANLYGAVFSKSCPQPHFLST